MKTPTYDQWLNERVEPLAQRELEELLGSAFIHGSHAPKALALLGDGPCGRTTLVNLLTEAVGRDSVQFCGAPTPTTPKLASDGLVGTRKAVVALFRSGDPTPRTRVGVRSRPLIVIECQSDFDAPPAAWMHTARITLNRITHTDPSVLSHLHAELPGIVARWVSAFADSQR
ncbi:hypothetical protein [Mycolicibacterium fortuitum]|uniref:hypothetical protein n=1 Tax=Mycolicibacterium fortuitum TaxID=1766 RepID=UPI001CDC9E75|nr:hypothetical protein [Mycolicibacterium fortuitum]UBV14971.1 hypothetical protein H8Z57_30535 [Mycolicibacterium fortuitum]